MSQYKVTKLRHLLRTGGRVMHCESDLVWIEGLPVVVLEWLDFDTNFAVPHVTITLDPKYLFDLPGWGEVTHGYQMELFDPRDAK